MQTSKVAIVIVTWNKKTFVLELLKSLQLLSYPNYDVVVVDNCSTDQTSDAIAEYFPDTIVISNPENTGGAGGFNIGLQYAQDNEYTYCWLLDNDVIVDKDALLYLVNTLESTPDASICGSQILIVGSDIVQECGGNINWKKANITLNNHGKPRHLDKSTSGAIEVDYCAACSMLARMTDVKLYGKIDPEMFIFWDDIEWSTRIKSFGKMILCNTNSVVWHHFNGYKPSNVWRVYYRVRNKLYFFNKYSKSKTALAKLLAIYEELQEFYHYMGIVDYSYSVESAITDFKNDIRGKWPSQAYIPTTATHFKPDIIPDNNYLVIYDHNYGQLSYSAFGDNTIHYVIDTNLSATKFSLALLKSIIRPSIAVGNQLNIFMLFSSFAILLTENGSRVIKNSKIKNTAFIIYRCIFFAGKYISQFK
ncbi:glycosyltransferase family 2 protein [Methylomonas sp. MED-D]|uniref:glycosyltransferase family 2 protein n=1 Tax=unclassified Methylomonas TaxID=2608980 RepID=UPI0028A4F592|nr:glycosyltransferase family 2 protein [Methylomonas sp. MV1]MDT4331803.1 glycosyltransferase family 2 protein [Methylomonas sp. MV1]